jgi:hypothetical protein
MSTAHRRHGGMGLQPDTVASVHNLSARSGIAARGHRRTLRGALSPVEQ